MLRNIIVGLCISILSITSVFASEISTSASSNLSLTIPEYVYIKPLTSPVLTANVRNRTGNLDTPLRTTFRVITNTDKEKSLYLQANVMTSDGYENAMFMQGGQVYIAFSSLRKVPTTSSLNNCKSGGFQNDSPGIVAYPVTSVAGAPHKYIGSKSKYEVYIKNGTTDISIDVGTNVLRSSFGSNDPRGFYQTVISLTEADI